MKRDGQEGCYVPVRGYLGDRLRQMHQFQDREFWPKRVTPLTKLGERVEYEIREYNPLLDSSNMGERDWIRIACDIGRYYDDFDAFLVLHGTDTMAYTASALSFLLDGLDKTVILTGSQIPISELHNDGESNLLGALVLCGGPAIPEVGLFFRNKLFRGNRARKSDASDLDAFTTPNFPPLATVGIDISINWALVRLFEPAFGDKSHERSTSPPPPPRGRSRHARLSPLSIVSGASDLLGMPSSPSSSSSDASASSSLSISVSKPLQIAKRSSKSSSSNGATSLSPTSNSSTATARSFTSSPPAPMPRVVARRAAKNQLRVQHNLCDQVGSLKIFPGIHASIISNYLRPPIRGLVLETFGAGNAPVVKKPFLDALKEGLDRGVIIVNITQCGRGYVVEDYATNSALRDIGVINGGDLTSEAALTKLMYLLGQPHLERDDIERLMVTDMRGELTPLKQASSSSMAARSRIFLRAFDRALAHDQHYEADERRHHSEFARMLRTSILIAAAADNDYDTIRHLYATGADISASNVDYRTPLHVAVDELSVEAADMLCHLGGNVHARDRFGNTPLESARASCHTELIAILDNVRD
jgi:L-asparaginase/Glu-tRNA(Gln) amidotransferase subunit D